MAMITPASDAFPSMIPPSDFPSGDAPDDPFEDVLPRDSSEEERKLVFIESRELHVLTGFLAAFSRYMADRHNPDASFDVLARYRAALRFYNDGDGDGQACPSGSPAGRAHSSSGGRSPSGGRPAASGRASSTSGDRPVKNRAGASSGGLPAKKRAGRPSGSRPAKSRAKKRAGPASGIRRPRSS